MIGLAEEDGEERAGGARGTLALPLAVLEAREPQLVAVAVVAAPGEQRAAAGGGSHGWNDVRHGVALRDSAHRQPLSAEAAAPDDLVGGAVEGAPGEEPGAVVQHGAGERELASRSRVGDLLYRLPAPARPGRGAHGEGGAGVAFEPGETGEAAAVHQEHRSPALGAFLAGRLGQEPRALVVSLQEEEAAAAGDGVR